MADHKPAPGCVVQEEDAGVGGRDHADGALQDLVQDDRTPATRRFLRKVYIDPMTGAADWTLIPAADGGFMGVASASKLVPIKQRGFDWTNQGFSDSDCYCKGQFIYDARLRPWQQMPRP